MSRALQPPFRSLVLKIADKGKSLNAPQRKLNIAIFSAVWDCDGPVSATSDETKRLIVRQYRSSIAFCLAILAGGVFLVLISGQDIALALRSHVVMPPRTYTTFLTGILIIVLMAARIRKNSSGARA